MFDLTKYWKYFYLFSLSQKKKKTVKGDRSVVPRYAGNCLWLFDIKSQEDKS